MLRYKNIILKMIMPSQNFSSLFFMYSRIMLIPEKLYFTRNFFENAMRCLESSVNHLEMKLENL